LLLPQASVGVPKRKIAVLETGGTAMEVEEPTPHRPRRIAMEVDEPTFKQRRPPTPPLKVITYN
jgi:hypothetical protein